MSRILFRSLVFLLSSATGVPGIAQGQCGGCPNGSFASAPRVFQASDQVYDVVAADFDRDGFLDVAATNSFVTGPVLLLPGDGRGGLAQPILFPTAQYPRSLETADFNRDGFPDLAFTFENSPTVGVLIGGAAGRFGPVVEFSTGAGTHPRDLVAADFNGDGASDLAVMNDNDEGVAILLGTGAGSFLAPTSFAVGNNPRAIAAADLNEDGKTDLAVTNLSEQAVSILLRIGNGTFAPRATFALPPSIVSIAVGHFNADTHADLAVSGGGFFEPARIAILLGDGKGGFGAATTVAPISTSELEVLDFNKDGKDDLAARAGGILLLFGNGNGTFQTPLSHPAGFSPQAFADGDFNSDGWTDFAIGLNSFPSAESLLVLLGNPSGLQRIPVYPGAFDPRAIAVGDFNHDGRSDLAIADNSARFYPAGSLTVLLALPDGSLGAPTTYLTVYAPASIRTADFNGDGHLDLACASSSQMSILLGTETGAFSSATNYMLGNPVSGIDTADFNRDLKLDIVFSSFEGVTILFGDGTGAFGSPLTHPVSSPSSPVTGDFNLDGNADVAMLGYRILYGDGTGHFGDVSYVDDGVSVQKFVVSDINGDGRLDLAGIGVAGGAVVLGKPTSGFGSPLPFPVEFDSYVRIALTPGDFDLDGRRDLGVLSGGNVSFLRGNGNGTFLKVGTVFAAVLASDLVTADFNNDGRFDLALIRATSPDSPVASDVSVLLNTNCLPWRLAISRNPSTCNLPGSPFEIQPIVSVRDDGDNVVSCATGSVQASILPGTGTMGAILAGDTTAPLSAGAANFSNLSVDLAGEGYVLELSKPGLISTRSRLFRENPGCKGPFNFFTLAPCRIVDTRNAPGTPWSGPSLLGNSTRTFPIAGRCGVPVTARSVSVNLTVVDPTDLGHLTLFPGGRASPLTSTINFRAGVIRANNAVLTLGDEGDVDVQCVMPASPANRVDFVLDVSGYFQ